MVHLFGDWFADITVIFLCFVIYLFLRINTKEKRTWNRLDLSFSFIIFLISAFQAIGSLVFEDHYYGPQEGLIITFAIMVITAITSVLTMLELRAAQK